MIPNDFVAVFEGLPDEEKTYIGRLADALVAKVKARHTGHKPLYFARPQALEVLARCGIWLIENKQTAL